MTKTLVVRNSSQDRESASLMDVSTFKSAMGLEAGNPHEISPESADPYVPASWLIEEHRH